ncbi:uncharacterized protein LOC121784262 [Salvia splendens]|uniref:uncharacterized protein LOC121784262 n=1 Tax=Salvia splendens TaxID=180675 RepID=UPI001C25D8F2|nr:uncharacterized protein LOC121784262 [Salvia splendens]
MSSHFVIWNAQGIANSRTQGTLKNMIDMYSVMFAAVIEPQTDPRPSFYSRRFGLQFGCANISGKIWIFAHRDWDIEVVYDSDQVLHVRVTAAIFPVPIHLSIVYAKCTRVGRYSLWDKLREISLLTDGSPWLVGGDFNIFLTEDERRGGTSERHGEMMDFADAIAECQLFDPGFDATRVTHLPRISSDHAPLLVRCQASLQIPRPSFSSSSIGLKVSSRDVFGNIFESLREAEEAVTLAQAAYDGDPTPTHRAELNRCTAEYVVRTRMEEDFWKQKAAIRWVRQKRVKSRIHVIQAGGQSLTSEEEIRQSAVGFFQQLLTSDIEQLGQPDLDILHSLPDSVDRPGLCAVPDSDEVRAAVFGISGDSASGPDGFSSLFFQRCWDIVGADVVATVEDFFLGAPMPRSFTATTIILLPKKANPETWAEYRPISLCNVTNKIITKILTARLAPLLPLVLAPNQSGFVKGRLLCDNVLLAKEMIHDIGRKILKRAPSPNLALKLDMAKAYDRVQWPFLLMVLERMGFPSGWVSMIRRCISSCWFSVLVNGSPAGFFQSTRGLRQGDPLSPSLFVLAADYLSRSLDRLVDSHPDMAYRAVRSSPTISHLSYADDIIIFTRAHREAVERLTHCLDHYSAVSGQMVNRGKSHFFLLPRFESWADTVAEVGGFQMGSFPFTYLGVPIYKGNLKADFLLDIRQKMVDRIHNWSHRHLSLGGRLALIKSTLMTIPLHILQVMEPYGYWLRELEQIMARFFWGTVGQQKKIPWVNWKNKIRLPLDEGGLGIRRLPELVTAFSIKLCPIWRRLTVIRQHVHCFIRWSLGEGKISFWDDVWVRDRPLRTYCQPGTAFPPDKVSCFLSDGAWHDDKLHELLVRYALPAHVLDVIRAVPIEVGGRDVMRWSLTGDGEFSTASAWELIRTRSPRHFDLRMVWNAGLTPTTSVFIWRLLLQKIPVDCHVQSHGISLASKCLCCVSSSSVESLQHLFVSIQSARSVRDYFDGWAPTLHISFIIPCLVYWFIWTERNSCKHRGISFRASHVIWQVVHQLRTLVAAGVLVPLQWRGCTLAVDFMPMAPPRRRVLRSLSVLWHPPYAPWVKLNTYGAFSTSTGQAGGRGVVRGSDGSLLRAFCTPLVAASGFEAELLALHHGLRMAM